jgi:hypothetical protein
MPTLMPVLNQAILRETYASIKNNKSKTFSKGKSVLPLSTPKTKRLLNQLFKKGRSICGNQGHKSVDCFPNAHKVANYNEHDKALFTTSPSTSNSSLSWKYCQNKSSGTRGRSIKECWMNRLFLKVSYQKVQIMHFLRTVSLLIPEIHSICAFPLKACLI